MKHLKEFNRFDLEDKPGKYYYSVYRERPYFTKQLDKMNISKKIQENLYSKLDPVGEDIIFIGVDHSFYRNGFEINEKGLFFVDNGYKYKGPISLTRDEINQIEAEKEGNKFNL